MVSSEWVTSVGRCLNFTVKVFVYNTFQLAAKYLRYYITSSSGKGHGIHSPFIFEFITRVLNDKTAYPEYDVSEKLRTVLLNDKRILTIQDFGAGSSVSKSNRRTAASIARNAAKPKKLAQLLFRLVHYYQPQTIIELGTSLGITTTCLSQAKPDAALITMEGAKEIAMMAQASFDKLNYTNIALVEGNFDETLPRVLAGLPKLDFAFIDGNHRQEPTERYFSQLLSQAHNDTILVFDDIHWSREMEAAWEAIKANPEVKCTIDLFFIGIVFFRQEFREKQHFTIRF